MIAPQRPVPVGRERGQASVELLGAVPAVMLLGFVCFQLLAVGYASVLAGSAAEAGALAIAGGGDGRVRGARSAPGWSSRRMRVTDLRRLGARAPAPAVPAACRRPKAGRQRRRPGEGAVTRGPTRPPRHTTARAAVPPRRGGLLTAALATAGSWLLEPAEPRPEPEPPVATGSRPVVTVFGLAARCGATTLARAPRRGAGRPLGGRLRRIGLRSGGRDPARNPCRSPPGTSAGRAGARPAPGERAAVPARGRRPAGARRPRPRPGALGARRREGAWRCPRFGGRSGCAGGRAERGAVARGRGGRHGVPRSVATARRPEPAEALRRDHRRVGRRRRPGHPRLAHGRAAGDGRPRTARRPRPRRGRARRSVRGARVSRQLLAAWARPAAWPPAKAARAASPRS